MGGKEVVDNSLDGLEKLETKAPRHACEGTTWKFTRETPCSGFVVGSKNGAEVGVKQNLVVARSSRVVQQWKRNDRRSIFRLDSMPPRFPVAMHALGVGYPVSTLGGLARLYIYSRSERSKLSLPLCRWVGYMQTQ